MKKGIVYLLGAGPGDPGLITVKAREVLSRADVVVYDRLINPRLLELARPDAELIYVGKEARLHTMKQEEIAALLVDKAKEGKMVARLHGGDPFVFGRGGEEAEVLAAAGVPFQIVPGVTSAVAVPAYAGIPVTHRRFASSVAFVAGHEMPDKGQSSLDWPRLATATDTLIFLMGSGNLGFIAEQLMRNGRDPQTPAAIIHRGTEPAQVVVQGTLANIVEKSRQAGLKPPVITVIGGVTTLRPILQWFDNRPLFGKRVLVTRTRRQASALSKLLIEEGAEPVELPVLEVGPPPDWGPLDKALGHLRNYDWIVFSSVHGVGHFFQRLNAKGKDARALGGAKLAAIGQATAQALEDQAALRPDLTPQDYSSAGLLAAFKDMGVAEKRLLLPRALEVPPELERGLRGLGAQVEQVAAYQTSTPKEIDPEVKNRLLKGEIDVITFTSSSTVRHLLDILGKDGASMINKATVACIGPVTSRTARDMGLRVDVESEEHTIPGLVEVMAEHFQRR
ncbi:MAG: uroporphyrinogen-III C-methyltransferase [Chloroflexi bacterium]|nr:uroporphyrinogen-III C-methyltransferase [Chloroflexota bacterium]